MLDLLWLIPTLPLLGFVVLMSMGARIPRPAAAAVGVGSVGLSALTTLLVTAGFLSNPPADHAFRQVLWDWIRVGGFSPQIGLHLDALSLVMTLVVTCVGFLIHFYSIEFMQDDAGRSRFFAYMNLFVCSMLLLVLADNLVLLYLGWEGVGLCSYLLIGFWYENPANGRAARKAFIVTRVGDTAMAIGLFLLFSRLGTLQIQELMARAAERWPVGSGLAVATAVLLLGGAVGKSAQLPLQTWLPDAMAGPTPVSALIHAATMVTAGVYLIARTHVLFALAPEAQFLVAVVGAATLLIAGFSALAQRDIKRVLAYSTISQIGYMFLALGVGAWTAAMFHFMTHACFKALLFLGAGAVSHSLHHEHDIFKMGGLRRALPVTFWTFLAGGAALAGFPLITSGFYSKDAILWAAFSSPHGSVWLWAAGLLGALITSLYVFRLIFIAFYGEPKTSIGHPAGPTMKIPLIILAVLSLIAGFVELPHTLGHVTVFSSFMETALPAAEAGHGGLGAEIVLQLLAAGASILGIVLAYLLFFPARRAAGVTEEVPFAGPGLSRFWLEGWGFDRLYDGLLVRPFVRLSDWGRNDFIDTIYTALAAITELSHLILRLTQSGRVRWYAAVTAAGAIVLLLMVAVL